MSLKFAATFCFLSAKKNKTDSIFSCCCCFFNFVLHVEGFHLRWCSFASSAISPCRRGRDFAAECRQAVGRTPLPQAVTFWMTCICNTFSVSPYAYGMPRALVGQLVWPVRHSLGSKEFLWQSKWKFCCSTWANSVLAIQRSIRILSTGGWVECLRLLCSLVNVKS